MDRQTKGDGKTELAPRYILLPPESITWIEKLSSRVTLGKVLSLNLKEYKPTLQSYCKD